MENVEIIKKLLKQDIELEEENYRAGIIMQADYNTLREIRNKIRSLRKSLQDLESLCEAKLVDFDSNKYNSDQNQITA